MRVRLYAVLATLLLAAALAPAQDGADQANLERFAFGMTVSFPGTDAMQFRLLSEPLPDLGQGGPVTELKLGPPLDLWVLGSDGNRIDVPGVSLVSPSGSTVEPQAAGHWRVDRPEPGYYELAVPPLGQPWRLWSAFHPFMARAEQPLSVLVGEQPGAVFLFPSREQVELNAPGAAEVGGEGITWIAFLPWDLFEPSAPRVRIEGETRLTPGRQLELRAVVLDPDDDVRRVTWRLFSGETIEGDSLSIAPTWLTGGPVEVTVEDATGATASATVDIYAPPLHEIDLPGLLMVQAEDFSGQGGGAVEITDRGSNVGKMITMWHQDIGHWLEWTLPVAEAGDYLLYARYATGSQNARRAVAIDGEVPDGVDAEVGFPPTGGFGNTPAEWRTQLLGRATLCVGEHTLRMTNLGDGLALDYLALIPAGEDE